MICKIRYFKIQIGISFMKGNKKQLKGAKDKIIKQINSNSELDKKLIKTKKTLQMNHQQPHQPFHPMNQPYINQRYSGQRRVSKNNNQSFVHHNNTTGISSYESQRLLQYSQVSSGSDGYGKQVYSRSSTNLVVGSGEEMGGVNHSSGNNSSSRRQYEQQQQQYYYQQQGKNSNLSSNRPTHLNNNNHHQSFPSNNNINNKLHSPLPPSPQAQQYQQQLSTNYLHQKIHYLQEQLQQLTRLLHEQSKHSYGSSGHQEYQEVAIQNAQLTIRVKELEEGIQKMGGEKKRVQQELMQLGVEYEKEHRVGNQLREKLLETNGKLVKVQRLYNQLKMKQTQNNSINNQTTSSQSIKNKQQHNSYTTPLQRQNTRLNQQIQNLLSKLHNLNLQINQQQSAKDQLMTKMNEQLEDIQKLRKELSDQQVEKLQLLSMNQYLKEEINYVNELAAKRQKELQEKYIKEEVERQWRNQNNNNNNNNNNEKKKDDTEQQLKQTITHLQNQYHQLQTTYKHLQKIYHELQSHTQHLQSTNHHLQSNQQPLKQHINSLQSQIIQLTHENQSLTYEVNELRKKPVTPNREAKSEPFKELFGVEESLRNQVRLLERELVEEKERHEVISKKYSEMMENRQTRIYQLQGQIRKLQVQVRTLRIQIQDKRKQRDQAREQCQKLQQKVQEIRSSKSFISINNNNSSWHERQNQNKLQRIRHQQRIKYEQTIMNNNEINKKLLEQKNLQLNLYHNTINQLQRELTNNRTQLHQLAAKLEIKDKELKEKEYLVRELQELQERHQQLINQVKLIKKSKSSLQEEWKLNEESIRKDSEIEIVRLSDIISQKNNRNTQLEQQLGKLQQLNRQLTDQLDTFKQQNQSNKSTINQPSKPINNPIPPHPTTTCPLCPQVLKQFSIYKQLMQLKFQTMNQMLDQLKISFIRAQFEIKDQIHKDKSKYEYWIQKYDSHDKEYRVLMERLWEWEKINARNSRVMDNDGLVSFGRFGGGKEQYISENGLRIIKSSNKQPNNNKNKPQPQAASHLSQIQYDLYLIKLQNSTLRSQISTLQKQLSQRDQNPQVQKQLQQLKKYSENLNNQNQQLKNHLSQLMMNQKKIIISNKELSFGGSGQGISSIGKRESMFERYSNIANINSQLHEKTRNEEKALASAELLISKLKKQNDNLIETKNFLQQQLEREVHKYRQLVKDLQSQRQKTLRQHQIRPQSNNNNLQLIDRHNIPFEYIKHHPQHKRLQTQYVALKRSYLEMDLEFKKRKQFYQEELQKMKIENEFHKERIGKLEESVRDSMKANLGVVNGINYNFVQQQLGQYGTMFSFNNNNTNTINQNPNNNQHKFSSQMSKINENAISMSLSHDTIAFNETKIKTLEERVLYLEKQVEIKCQQCQVYAKKYQQLIKQLKYHPHTPRSNHSQQNINKIQKMASHIDVSPIQSPQWHSHQPHSAQHQHSDRLFPQSNTVSFDQKIIEKLKLCIDKKMIELQITPRESSNIVIKATWFIERLANDIRELRNNLEILKGQRKAIMKERNELKNIIENGENEFNQKPFVNDNRGFKKPHQPQRYQDINTHQNNHLKQANQSTGYQFHKPKPSKTHQLHEKIPKLNFDSNDPPMKQEQTNENHFPDVIRETLQLKNHRRSGLKKFQKQLEILSEN